MTKIIFDTEFTGLDQKAKLISIGLITETGETFYGVCDNVRNDEISDWVRENVIDHLYPSNADITHIGNPKIIGCALALWLARFEQVEIWSDCLAYDWVLFCEMFGGAVEIPKNVYYIPFDLATLMKVKGVDPDVNREEFSGVQGKKHNALHDARTIKACYEKLIQPSFEFNEKPA